MRVSRLNAASALFKASAHQTISRMSGYTFCMNVMLGEKKYSPPRIVTNPPNCWLYDRGCRIVPDLRVFLVSSSVVALTNHRIDSVRDRRYHRKIAILGPSLLRELELQCDLPVVGHEKQANPRGGQQRGHFRSELGMAVGIRQL